MRFQVGQALRRRSTRALGELVSLETDAGVARIGVECLAVGGFRILTAMADVEVGDAEVSPCHGEGRIERGGTFPGRDRLFVAPPVVEPIAEVIRRARIVRIRGDGALHDRNFLEPAEEGRPRHNRGGDSPVACRVRRIPGSFVQPAQMVMANRDQGIAGICRQAGLGCRDRVSPKAGGRQVERHIEVRLKVAEPDRAGRLLQLLRRPSALECGPQVQGITLQRGLRFAERLLRPPDMPLHRRVQVPRLEVVRLE